MAGSSGARQLDLLLEDRSPDAILREVTRAGARFDRVVLTRNRRIMASSADRGRTLRLHESFRAAPPAVLHALGRLFSARRREVRESARAEVRAYLEVALRPERSAAPRRRPPPPIPSDVPHVDRLRQEFDRLNALHFDSSLPSVAIRISGRMRRRIGHFCSDPLEIAISRELCERGSAGEAEETLAHEMIHLWQWHTGAAAGHGADFRRWARRLGITPRAVRTVRWAADHPFACR